MRPLNLYIILSQRQHRAQRRRAGLRERSGQAAFGCGAVLSLVFFAVVIAGALAYAALVAGLPAPERLQALLDPDRGVLLQPTRIYDSTGLHLLYSLENPGAPRRYLWVDPDLPDHISPLLVRLAVDANDPGFWQHPGFTRQSLLSAEPVTLTEKLVDRLLLSQEPPGLRRTLRARLLAAQVTARYGRAQVLEWELNSANFGHLAYGAESAAQLYFNKSARSLSLAEAAVLVAVEQSPALNPLDAPAAARERQQAVLDGLMGLGIISEEDYLTARTAPLEFARPLESPPGSAEAFSRLAVERLADRFGRERVERGGLRVITSLDFDLQLEMTCMVRAQLLKLEGSSAGEAARADGKACEAGRLLPTLNLPDDPLPPDLQASTAIIDLQSGEVRAYVGDTSLTGENPDPAGHQPGSLLAPFVALAGFARGMGPATLVWDIPAEGSPVELTNLDGRYHGPLRLRTALANDYLLPLEGILRQVGPQNVWRLAGPLGLERLEQAGRQNDLLVQGGPVGLIDLGQAYATLARMGEQVGQRSPAGAALEPVILRSVQTFDGEVWLEPKPAERKPVLTPALAYLLHDILSDDTARRPSLGYPNPLDTGFPSAAKVGRAQGSRQVWTVGYTPQRLAVTWLGLPADSRTGLDVKMAAGLWHAAVRYAARDLPPAGWQEPAGISRVDVCDPSGLLPTRDCPDIVTELFLNGSEPVELDTLYRRVQVNRETGRLATVFTPPEQVIEQTYLVPPAEARAWAEAAGWPQPPESYDSIQEPAVSQHARLTSPALFAAVRGRVQVTGTAAGDNFKSFRVQVGQGLNPQSWFQVGAEGQAPVQGGLLAEWDTAGLDGLYAVRLQVIDQDNRVETATIQVTVDNLAPELQVLYPSAGQVIQRAGEKTVTLPAQARDNIQVARVEWWVDGLKVGQAPAAPFSLLWQAAPGRHRLEVRAYDQAGNVTTAPPVDFVVE